MELFGEEFKNKIVPKITTNNDIVLMGECLDTIFNSTYSVDPLSLDSLKDKVPDTFSWKMDLISECNLINKDSDFSLLRKNLQILMSGLNKKQRLIVNLPFEPSSDFKNKLSNIFKEYLNKSLVVETVLDLSIEGGARLFFDGKYMDISIKNRIKHFLGDYNALK